jgi:acetylornithine deacetylase/succinyl-diaminopimelate desuccinylase-like protein
MFRRFAAAAALALCWAAPAFAQFAQALGPFPHQPEFRDLYRELVETDTTQTHGSCSRAAEAMAQRLRAAGFPDKDIAIFAPPARPQDGNLTAVLHGTDPKAKALMLLAHIDVVEAKREDWVRDPFKLNEEAGYFFARGASDDKAMAASFTDALIRYRQEGFKPRRDIKLALTCGEEGPDALNGAKWMLANHRAQMDAGLALNEGAGGRLEGDRRVFLGIQAGEKVYQDFTLETTNPGGHSSRPVKDNAIYRLGAALGRIGAYEFPIRINQATRLHFERMGPVLDGELGKAMTAAAAIPAPASALDALARDPGYNGMMRTTCVATQIEGGHAQNALPQRATANVNCRILPDESVDDTEKVLRALIADPQVKLSAYGEKSPRSPPPPLTPALMSAVEATAHELWPGVPVIPAMSTGATDGRFMLAAGIPTYGLSGMFADPDGSGVHGLNERIRVRSLYEGREFLYRVVKRLAQGPE